jgi:hypothetical protein
MTGRSDLSTKDLGLAGKDALELLAKAPDPASAARLTVTQVTAECLGVDQHFVGGLL